MTVTIKAQEMADILRHQYPPPPGHPVTLPLWVPIDDVHPNDYNPNSVARTEMGLLVTSILADGFTQPIVTVWNPGEARFEIIDGFHRWYVAKHHEEVHARCNGLCPIVVTEASPNDRMASTVRHNRARGKHSVQGMSSMVFEMLEGGWEDAQICSELGLEAEELIRLKHITGFSKLFADTEYRNEWKTNRQIRLEKAANPAAIDLDAPPPR